MKSAATMEERVVAQIQQQRSPHPCISFPPPHHLEMYCHQKLSRLGSTSQSKATERSSPLTLPILPSSLEMLSSSASPFLTTTPAKYALSIVSDKLNTLLPEKLDPPLNPWKKLREIEINSRKKLKETLREIDVSLKNKIPVCFAMQETNRMCRAFAEKNPVKSLQIGYSVFFNGKKRESCKINSRSQSLHTAS